LQKCSIRLRIALLSFIREAVVSQPGLMELLLDVKFTFSNGKKTSEIQQNSCLHEVMWSIVFAIVDTWYRLGAS
jgi:hypothetical protein